MPASQVRNVIKKNSYENKIEDRVKAINWKQPRNELPRYVKSIMQKVTGRLKEDTTKYSEGHTPLKQNTDIRNTKINDSPK